MASWSAIARRIRVPLGFAFAVVYLLWARPTSMSMLIGTAFIIPGLLVRALASGHVRKNEELTTSGPYAYTRNPLYLGSLILAVGFLVAARNWWIAAAALAVFLFVYLPVIAAEENYLRERFPQFAEYARQVPRLLPRLSPFHNSFGGFSWELYRKHHEYEAALGALGMVAALAAKMLWMSH